MNLGFKALESLKHLGFKALWKCYFSLKLYVFIFDQERALSHILFSYFMFKSAVMDHFPVIQQGAKFFDRIVRALISNMTF